MYELGCTFSSYLGYVDHFEKVNSLQASLVASSSVEDLLTKQSIKRKLTTLRFETNDPEGKMYDKTGEGVLEHIKTFINTNELPLDELLVQDLTQYPVSH
jgi:hypothetical protein